MRLKWMVRIRNMGSKFTLKCVCLRVNPFSSLLPPCSTALLQCLWGHKGGWLKKLMQKICKPPQVSISASLAPGSVRFDLSQEKQKQLVRESGGSRAALLPAASWPISFAITWNLTLSYSELGFRYLWLHPENIPSDCKESCRCPALLKKQTQGLRQSIWS